MLRVHNVFLCPVLRYACIFKPSDRESVSVHLLYMVCELPCELLKEVILHAMPITVLVIFHFKKTSGTMLSRAFLLDQLWLCRLEDECRV